MATITVNQVLRTPSLTTERKAWDAVGQLTANFVALLVKLDADSGVGGTDYAATLTPADQITSKP